MSGPTDKDPADQDLPDEQQLEAYLKGGSSVSQQYRQLRSAEVPAELDRLVLRQAQEAVTTRPAKSRVWMRWTAPLAVAASAVLVMSIVIQSGVQHEVRLEMPASAPAPAPTTMEAERKRETVDEDMSASAAVETQRARAPVLEGLAAERAERSHAPPADVSISPVEPVRPQFAPPPAELRFETPAAPAPAAPLPQTASNSRRQGAVEADKAAKALSAEAAVEADATREVEEVAVTGNQLLRGKQPRAAGPRGTVPTTRPMAAVADSTSTGQVAEQLHPSDPDLWLHEIRKLRLQDKQEEADREWRRFRELFPDHPVEENDTAREVQR